MKPLTTLRPARATKNINSDSNYSTVNVVAAGRWPASSIFGPQQDPAVSLFVCLSVRQKPLTTQTGPRDQISKPKTIWTLIACQDLSFDQQPAARATKNPNQKQSRR